MSIECPKSPVYNTSAQQKIQAKNAAKVYRFGSPKLRDLLREKCRLRVRKARENSYCTGRRIYEGVDEGDDVMLPLDQILRQELADLEHDINLQEEIYKELISEVDEWFVEQLEEEESYLISKADNVGLICPICQKASLTITTENRFSCICGISFMYSGGIEGLRQTLQQKIDTHEQHCLKQLSFFLEPNLQTEYNNLNVMCATCDYFCTL